MVAKTQEFYREFYGYNMSAEEATLMLDGKDPE